MKVIIAIIMTILMPEMSIGQVTINEVIANQKKSGEVLLDQGYKGSLKVLTGKNLLDKTTGNEFEFTHAALNYKGPFLQAPVAQGVCVGIDVGPGRSSYRMTAIYSKELPDTHALSSAKTMDELIRLLGKPRSMVPDGPSGASSEWDLFSLNDEGALDVISVLAYFKKDGERWSVNFLRVAKGVFHPTGARPRLEKEAERFDTGQPATCPASKPEGSDKPQPESQGRSR
jgi:hypothetical protein